MFKHINHTIERPFVKTAHDETGHYYITPDGKKYPSITTIFKLLDDMSWYEHWVNSIMKKLDMTKKEAEVECKRIGNESMEVGTELHKMAEGYLNNSYPVTFGRYEVDINMLFESLKEHLDSHVNNIHGTESELYSDELELAGTVDCIAEYDGVLSVIDFKNSRKPKTNSECKKKNYYTQITAYAKMWEFCTGQKIDQGVILVISWDGKVKPFIVKIDDHEEELWNKLIEIEQYKALNS